MEYRGHILLVFGLSLMISPVAIRLALAPVEVAEAEVAPARVMTDAQAAAECERGGIDTALGRLGCTDTVVEARGTVQRIDRTMTYQNEARRLQTSGALFVSAPTK